jgi:thiol-disulfide isomerase/thioredoxin
LRAAIALLLALAVAGCDKPKPAQPQAEAVKEPAGRVDVSAKGQDAPAKPFLGPDDGPATLAKFRGRPLMVNLWATWCAPCVAEMPTLDKLAGREKDRFQLIVVSQDLAGRREVTPFFDKNKFANLQPYLDKENVLMEALKIDTLPTTIFYDAKGKEQWRVVGAMNWEGADAAKLIDGAVPRPS